MNSGEGQIKTHPVYARETQVVIDGRLGVVTKDDGNGEYMTVKVPPHGSILVKKENVRINDENPFVITTRKLCDRPLRVDPLPITVSFADMHCK
tara:strand:- start:289 stop:570 length:282 start_codon:yes stop_codon:yes gene_type:complete